MTSDLICPLCDKTTGFNLIFRGSHALYKCGSCTLIFSDRVMNPDMMNLYINNEDGFFDVPYFTEATSKQKNPDYPNYKRALEKVKAKTAGSSPRLLDVGCGTGTLIEVAAEVGFKPEGLEV